MAVSTIIPLALNYFKKVLEKICVSVTVPTTKKNLEDVLVSTSCLNTSILPETT